MLGSEAAKATKVLINEGFARCCELRGKFS